MSIFDAGAAFRTWAARQGLAPSVAAAQVTDLPAGDQYFAEVTEAFAGLEAPLARAINARRVEPHWLSRRPVGLSQTGMV
jgi:hypothetical protein